MKKLNKSKEDYVNYVCPRCFNQIQNCKCEFMPLELLHIDEHIQEHIRILNRKKYITTTCCESHADNKNIGVVFACRYKFDALPEGFTYKEKLLNYSFKEKNTDKYEVKKKVILEKLLNWIEELPENKEGIV